MRSFLRFVRDRLGFAPTTDVPSVKGRPETFFLPAGYRSRPVAQYFDDFAPSDPHAAWQPDVYRLAGLIAGQGGRRIIDVGCGKGEKLRALAAQNEIIGIDFGENIRFCRAHCAFGQWLEHDLEAPQALPVPASAYPGAVVVCADVIEHLVDPSPLLRKLKEAADAGATVLLSTPERPLMHGRRHRGPPRNPAHVREWSLAELKSLVRSVGFEVVYAGLTADNDADRRMITSLTVLRGAVRG